MGSYLSAPMLVFRLSVLPRTCETPCGGDGPAGRTLSHERRERDLSDSTISFPSSLSSPPTSSPFPEQHLAAARYFFFFFFFFTSSHFAVALVAMLVCAAFPLPLYLRIYSSLVTFHIQSPRAYLTIRPLDDPQARRRYVRIKRERMCKYMKGDIRMRESSLRALVRIFFYNRFETYIYICVCIRYI